MQDYSMQVAVNMRKISPTTFGTKSLTSTFKICGQKIKHLADVS
jgi:hypothetical protein